MDPTPHIRLPGGFRLVYGDDPVTAVDSPRLQSLVAYLVLHRDVAQPRRLLAFLLWPDSEEAQARTSLRNLLHHLRRASGGDEEALVRARRALAAPHRARARRGRLRPGPPAAARGRLRGIERRRLLHRVEARQAAREGEL